MKVVGGLKLSTRHLFLVVPVAFLAWVVTGPFNDNSFLWHVRAGTLQLDNGQVLTADPFSIEFTGAPWRTQSWLADLFYGSMERTFDGIGWAPFFMFAMAAVTVAIVMATVQRSTGHLAVAAALGILVTWQAVPFANARPVVFSYLLLAIVVVACRESRVEWTIPGIVWLWAALHGSFVLGIGLVTLEAIRRRSRRFVELAVLSGVLASLTAHGLGVWQTLGKFLGSRAALETIREWAPPDLTHPLMVPYAILIVLTLWAATQGALSGRDLIVVAPFLIFGLLAVRNLYPALIVVVPYIACGVTPTIPEVRRRDSPMFVAVAGLAIVAFGIVGLLRPVTLAEDTFPSPGAVAALRDGPVFHGIGPGGFFIFSRWPQEQVLVDDRAELYGAAGFERYLDAAEGIAWESLFGELEISQALVDTDWPLGEVLLNAGWDERYRDDYFAVLAAPGT